MASPPVGIIISGRPVLTDARVASGTEFAFEIPSQPSFSHIAVFLLPGIALPDGHAAAVYAQLPGATQFKLLGAIANEKPSAIFKVTNKAGGLSGGGIGDDDAMVDETTTGTTTGTGTLALGVSIEQAQQVAAALEAQKAAVAATAGSALVLRGQNTVTTKVLAQRIIKNCYDFFASYGSDAVPIKAFEAWWAKFENKIERDPGFLERSDGG